MKPEMAKSIAKRTASGCANKQQMRERESLEGCCKDDGGFYQDGIRLLLTALTAVRAAFTLAMIFQREVSVAGRAEDSSSLHPQRNSLPSIAETFLFVLNIFSTDAARLVNCWRNSLWPFGTHKYRTSRGGRACDGPV